MAPVSGNTNLTPLQALSEALASAVETVAASTVAVRGRGRHALGSGVVWRPGILVTAAHVFGRAPAIASVIAAQQGAADLALVGVDAPTDLAVFRLPDEQMPAVETSSSASARAGQLAVLVGRSQGAEATASLSVIHRVSGPWQTWLGGRIDRLIRLDAGLRDGQSGGPVADAAGKVFGMATSALSRTTGIVIPDSTISRVVDELLARGHVARAFLGISAQPAEAGLLVTAMLPGGPAAQAGLLVGDILVDVGEHRAVSMSELRDALAGNIGKSVRVSLIRGGAPAEVDVTVGQWPAEARAC